MKNKPKRHKSLNTFKFQTFSERISSIDIDVFHRVKHPFEEEDEELTHYSQCLVKWSTENFSPGYAELNRKLPHGATSLPLLLVQKDVIMKTLIQHLKSCDIESLQPALELIVAVAKDLEKENFFPYFNPEILQECVNLLDTREVEQIEWVFTCLAHLFKYLRAIIVKNINIILPQLLPLLSSNKPHYINDFAAESFAFVARSVKDKSQFLSLCLKNVKNNPDELVGVSKLFFAVTKGVGHEFHSCLEGFLTVVLKQLEHKTFSKLLFEICEHYIAHINRFITAKTKIDPVWNTFMKIAKEFSSKWEKKLDPKDAENLTLILKLFQNFISGREVVLRDPQNVVNYVMDLASNPKIKDFMILHEVVVDFITFLLTYKAMSSQIEPLESIINKTIENIDEEKLLVRFVAKIIPHKCYEYRVFQEFLKYVNSKGLNDFLIQFLVKIVHIKSNFNTDFDDNKLGFYSLSLKSVKPFSDVLLNKIQSSVSPGDVEFIEDALNSIIILSYLDKTNHALITITDTFIQELCKSIEIFDTVGHKAKLLYILLLTVQYRIKSQPTNSLNFDSIIETAMKFASSSNYLCSLRILSISAPFSSFECLNIEGKKSQLVDNLSSPFHKVRLFSSQVLSKMNIHPIFEQISAIEMIIPSIDTYRDKLLRLQKFEHNELFLEFVSDDFVKLAVLKFLLGNLYINFLYIWEPIQNLIQSHLQQNPKALEVILQHLEKAVDDDLNSFKILENVETNFKCEFFKLHFYEVNGVDDRPDFFNFRCLTLNILTNLSHQYLNTDFIAQYFLKFYKNEYKTSLSEYSAMRNVKKITEEPINLEENDKKSNKNYNKVFLIYLKLISNVASQISQKYRSEIFDIHFDLLSNGNSDIQKFAVNYVCKVKGFNAHKERLNLLTNDNAVKDQLMNLRIDLNSNSIPEQDVGYLMKIILKLLFGKIRKKSAVDLRSAMFEFLVSCKNDQITFFFDMIFKEFCRLIKDSSDPVIHQHEQQNLENVFSPSWLLSYINYAIEIFKRCGSLLHNNSLSYLLRVVFKCMSCVAFMYGRRSEVHPSYYGLMSKVRSASFEAIIYFLENYDYSWSESELTAFFKFFVDPWIEKVSEECLQSPNWTMKLFITFTRTPRYFPFLSKKCGNTTPIGVLIGLLVNDKVYFNVKNSVVEVIEKLLTLEEEFKEEDNSEFMHLDDSNIVTRKKNQRYGTILLMPHVSVILQYLELSLSKRYIKLNSVYMLILKRISEFGLNEQSSVALLNLLMPILRSKANADDDVVLPLLNTVINLFKTFENHEKYEDYLVQLAQLFGVVTTFSVRRLLCDLIKYIGEKTENKLINHELICGLNLNDTKWIDQPDYTRRLETFKNINEAREKEEINLHTGIFIIYNCFYTIKNEKDMGLRDHSGLCLKYLCSSLCKKYLDEKKLLNKVLNEILLPIIKEGIQSNTENFQHEALMLFGHLVRDCKEAHPVFRDLNVLTNSENIEKDFFENILHLQHHRRITALKLFSDVMSKQVRAPAPYALTFVFPLVTGCLLVPKLANEHGLINCAIEALRIICHLSSWHQYEKILKFYIIELRKNASLRKQAIRIVSVILDAFHFDITNADEKNKSNKSNIGSIKKDEDAESMRMDDLEAVVDLAKDYSEMEHIEKNIDADPMEVDNSDTAETKEKEMLPVVERTMILCRSDATRVYKSIKSFLIPSLDRIFMTYDDSDQFHKLSKKNSRDEKEEMAQLSIPIAFAIVKLMKRLPRSLLDQYTSTLFLKLSTYLKSRLLSIRKTARETMEKILIEIGPGYLPRLLFEMKAILRKGFQIHVLVFTCHAILEKIRSLFVEGEIDCCVKSVIEICMMDLFGKFSEEKEVSKIVGKTPEAKGNKSYNMFTILSEHISKSYMLDLVLPLKDVLAENMSSKTVNKVRRSLQYIALGLSKNKFISTEALLEFAYNVSNDCIPQLVAEKDNNKVQTEHVQIKKPNTLLIPEEPRKLKPELSKTCARTNAHVIIEFGVELLESVLKREILKPHIYGARLNLFIPLIKDCLHSQYIKLKIISLKCLVKLVRKNLPSLNENINEITESVFGILGEYSSPAMTGDNAELLMAATKLSLVLVHDVGHKINNEQLRILLFVAEDLLKNISHYGTGFSLIRAIIKRKYNLPEFHELMKNVSEISIKSYSDHVRGMAREVFFKYLMDYPWNKKSKEFLMFYLSQIEYDVIDGRKSALEMMNLIIKNLPEDVLTLSMELMFVKMSLRLSSDDSPECKKIIADCLTLLITRFLKTKELKILFDTTMIWMKHNKVTIRQLAVQLLGIFVSTEKEKFVFKLPEVLPSVENQLHINIVNEPGKFVKAPIANNPKESETEKDHLLFQVLQLYKTLTEVCPSVLTNTKFTNHISRIGESCQCLLRSSHEWVRLGAIQVLGIIFKSIDPAEVSEALRKPRKRGFLRDGQTKELVRSLCLDFCDQLVPGHDVMEQVLKQTMKNLLFLAESLVNAKPDAKQLSLLWLVKKLKKQIQLEVSLTPQKYTTRIITFNWFAALAVKLDEDKLQPLLNTIFTPIIRELSTTDEQGLEMRRIAKEVLKFYREKISRNVFDDVIVKIQRDLDIKKAKRKADLAQMTVTDPERAARRRVKSQLKKKEQKKRRLEKLRKRKFKSGKRIKPIEISNE